MGCGDDQLERMESEGPTPGSGETQPQPGLFQTSGPTSSAPSLEPQHPSGPIQQRGNGTDPLMVAVQQLTTLVESVSADIDEIRNLYEELNESLYEVGVRYDS